MNLKNIIVKIALLASQKPIITIAMVVLFAAFCSVGLSQLSVNVSNDKMFKEDDPTLVAYKRFQKQFGRDDIVIVAINSDDVFSANFMRQLRTFHEEVEQSVPWLDDVTSLANVDWMIAKGDLLQVGELGDEWPTKGEVSAEIKADVLNNPLYQNILISEDGKTTLLVLRALAFESAKDIAIAKNRMANNGVLKKEDVGFGEKIIQLHDEFNAYLAGEEYKPPEKKETLATEAFFEIDDNIAKPVESTNKVDTSKGLNTAQLNQFLQAINHLVDKHQSDNFAIRLTGGPVIDKAHSDAIHADVLVLVALALLVIMIALFILLRSWLAVFAPLLIIVISVSSTLGVMGFLDMPISVVSQALPPLLLTVGVLDSVHLLGIFYLLKGKGNALEVSLKETFERAGVAIFYTSLTTAAGFISFTIARLKPISDFGWIAAFGVMLVMLFSFLLIPAFLSLFDKAQKNKQHVKRWETFARLITPLAIFAVKKHYAVLGGVLLVIIMGVPGILQLNYSHNVITWFGEDAQIKKDTLSIDAEMKATVPLEVVVDTGVENGILTPDFMARLQKFQKYAESLNFKNVGVGRVNSLVNPLERIHSQLDSNAKANVIPDTEALIQQEILLYEGGGAKEIERLTDRAYSMARITIRLTWEDAREYVELKEQLLKKAQNLFGNTTKIIVTGTVDLVSTGVIDIIKSMKNSYLLATILIGLMLIVLLKRVAFGLACLAPNLLPIYIVLSLMGYMGIPIDMFTVLLGGIALGLAVDDTVHLTHSIFNETHQKQASLMHAVKEGVAKVAPAIVVTTAVISIGFSLFAFSSIAPLSVFGLLLCLVMILALVCDVLVIPALFRLFQGVANASKK